MQHRALQRGDCTATAPATARRRSGVDDQLALGSADNKTIHNTTKVLGLGSDVAVGPMGKPMLQWSKFSPVVGADRTSISAGDGDQMCKRSDLCAVLMNDKLDGLKVGKRSAPGVRHRF